MGIEQVAGLLSRRALLGSRDFLRCSHTGVDVARSGRGPRACLAHWQGGYVVVQACVLSGLGTVMHEHAVGVEDVLLIHRQVVDGHVLYAKPPLSSKP